MGQAKRIAIVGAGPIGLEAALHARQSGHSPVIWERGENAANVAGWGFVRMFTPWSMNTTPAGRKAAGGASVLASEDCPTGRELRDRYLLPLAESPVMSGVVQTDTRVISIGRDTYAASGHRGGARPRFRLLLTDRSGIDRIDHADVVLDCSGTYGNRRWAGRGGIPAAGEFGLKDRIWYTIPDLRGAERLRFAGRRTLLVGAGHSAATVLLSLASLAEQDADTHVTWVHQREGQVLRLIDEDPLPQRRALAEKALRLMASPPPWLTSLEDTFIERISLDRGLAVDLRRGEEPLSCKVDEIVALIGYRPDTSIFEQLRVHRFDAAGRPVQPADIASDGDISFAGPALENPAEPGFYMLGAKSFGTDSAFLLRMGHRQIRDVFRQIEVGAGIV